MKAKTFNELLKEKIEKFNPWHDARGRFTSGGSGGASFSANPNTKAGQMAIDREAEKNPLVGVAYQGDRDKAAVADGIEKVRNSVSNEAKALEREGVKLEKVMKEAGCDKETAEKAAAEAKAIYDRVSSVEPKITSDIVGAVDANNGTMYGLDFRMKQETSLARKIASDASKDFNGDLKASADDIKDAVRYTAVFEAKDFTAGYNNVKKSLEEKGYKEDRCKNYYQDYANGDSQQKAVQCVFSDPTGNRLELQFHTYESQGAKEVNHPLYEQFRAADTSEGQKKILDRRMKDIGTTVPDPDGVFSIKAHR